MRTLAAILVLTVLLAPSLRAETRTSAAGTYYVYKPAGATKAPLVVFLHGQGGDETQGQRCFERYVAQRTWGLVAPRGPSPQGSWFLDGGAAVRAMVEEVLAEGGFDPARILMVGYSAGGTASYDAALNNTDFYAALAAVNCYMSPGSAPLGRKLPVLLVECEGDPNLPAARQAESYLKSAGFSVTFDLLPGGSHAYPTDTATPRILEWFSSLGGGTPPSDGSSSSSPPSSPPSSPSPSPSPGTPTDGGTTSTPSPATPTNDGTTSADADGRPGTSADVDERPGTSADAGGTAGTTATDTGRAGTTAAVPPPAPPPPPIVNTFGVGVGGLTDAEIEGLVRRWLDTVYKPSQRPPDTEHGWTLDDWGIWVCGLVQHVGGIDGYGSITDFWIRTNADCLKFATEEGARMHPPAEAAGTMTAATAGRGAAPTETTATARASERPTAATGTGPETGAGTGNGATGAGGAGGAEQIPDLAKPPEGGGPETGAVDGRSYDLMVPDGYRAGDGGWGLVVALTGIAGNTDYLKIKFREACASERCLFVGLQAKNATGSTFGFRWENDQAENLTFIRSVADSLEKRYGLDTGRTYLVGFSNGAHFLGQVGDDLDDLAEGYVMCEGGRFVGSGDRQVLVAGSSPTTPERSDSRWTAFCEGMGHKFPGVALPAYQDPGVTTSSDGLAVDPTAILEWLR